MVLIEHDNIHRLGERQNGIADSAAPTQPSNSVQTVGTPLSRLDAEMSEILNSDSYKSERDKWTAYIQVLQRYLRLAHSQHNDPDKLRDPEIPKKTTQMETDEEIDTALTDAVKSRLNDTLIIDSVPKKFHTKAKMLLRSLHRNTTPAKKISWDTNGTVSIGGTRIPNSNIVDLVNDAMRARKREKPVGRAHFAAHLRKIQMPREFIGNPELFQEPRQPDASTPRKRIISPKHYETRAIGVSGSSSSSEYEESGSTVFHTVAPGESPEEEDTLDKTKIDRRPQQGRGHRTHKKLFAWSALKL